MQSKTSRSGGDIFFLSNNKHGIYNDIDDDGRIKKRGSDIGNYVRSTVSEVSTLMMTSLKTIVTAMTWPILIMHNSVLCQSITSFLNEFIYRFLHTESGNAKLFIKYNLRSHCMQRRLLVRH